MSHFLQFVISWEFMLLMVRTMAAATAGFFLGWIIGYAFGTADGYGDALRIIGANKGIPQATSHRRVLPWRRAS